jgi:hypothetical protein
MSNKSTLADAVEIFARRLLTVKDVDDEDGGSMTIR